MSVEYCYKHHHYYDTDFIDYCDGCLTEEQEKDETFKRNI